MIIPGGTPIDIAPCRNFWDGLDRLATEQAVVIERPKGTRHPAFAALIYPVDHGRLEEGRADGGAVGVWRGNAPEQVVCAVACTVDLLQPGAGVELLIGCTEEECRQIEQFHNQTGYMKGILIKRA